MQQAHTAETSARETTGRATEAAETTGGTTEAVGARDDRTRYGSCWRARRSRRPAGGAGPVARAAGRNENQPVRVTSAL